jgi:pimeloyl-ACP methyl ester carboxylesterase
MNQTASNRSTRREALRKLGLGFPLAWAAGLLQRTSASRFVEIRGVKLHYLAWGDRRARPLLLLHPAPLNAHVWDAFGPVMSTDYHVVAPDARGFGDSQWSDAYSDDSFVEDIRALLTALGLKRPILCGNSMGGTLAYTYASLYPEDVERLILVDTGPGEKPLEPGAPTVQSGPPRGGPPPVPAGPFATPRDAAARVPAIFGAAFVEAMVQHNLKQGADGRWHWKNDPAIMEAGERSMRDSRKWPRWIAVRCPTLVLRGERSPALPQRLAEQMVAENKNASLAVVANAGHFIPIEQPAAFEAAVRKWLAMPV